jgi:hypothetical protein
MQDLGWLQTIGIVLCVGGILLVVLIAFAARSLFGRRNPQQMSRNDERVWREQGQERPRYDSPQVESRGGFGNAPSSSSSGRRERDLDFADTGLPATGRQDLDDDRTESGDRLQNYRRQQDQARSSRSRQRDDDDDEVRSRGGFGG